LNSYVSLNKPIYDEDSDRTLLDVLSGSKISDPEDLVISREEFIDIEEKMGEILSDLEWKVLMAYLDRISYQEIAVELQIYSCHEPDVYSFSRHYNLLYIHS